jgi:hypothetical protein
LTIAQAQAQVSPLNLLTSLLFLSPHVLFTVIDATPKKLSIFKKPKLSHLLPIKKREIVIHPIWLYEIHGKIEEETFLLSADFGNAFPSKDYLLNNPHHSTKFFTLQDRKTKFEKKGRVWY